MEAAINCSVCGSTNPAESAYCFACRSRLSTGASVSPEQGITLDPRNPAPRINRRAITRVALIAIAAALAVWLAYTNLGPFRFLNPPASAISSIPGPDDWAMSQRGPDRNAFVNIRYTLPGGKLKWSYNTSSPIYSSPAVVDGRIYLAKVRFFYTRQSSPKGNGDALLCAKDFIGSEPFAFSDGDSIIDSRVPVIGQLKKVFQNVYQI